MNERVPDIMPTILMSRDVGLLLDDIRMEVDIQGIVDYLSCRGLTNDEIEKLTIEFSDEVKAVAEDKSSDLKVTYGQYIRKNDQIFVYMTPQLKTANDTLKYNFDPSNRNNIPNQINDFIENTLAEQDEPTVVPEQLKSIVADIRIQQVKESLVDTIYNSRSADISDVIAHEVEHRLLKDNDDIRRAKRWHAAKALGRVASIVGGRAAVKGTQFVGACYVASMDSLYRLIADNETLGVGTQVLGGVATYAILGSFFKPLKTRLNVADDFEYTQYLTDPEEVRAREAGRLNNQQFVSFVLK